MARQVWSCSARRARDRPDKHKTSAPLTRAQAAPARIWLRAITLRRGNEAFTKVVRKVVMWVVMCGVLFQVRCVVGSPKTGPGIMCVCGVVSEGRMRRRLNAEHIRALLQQAKADR